jgi:hypothetical protein
MKLELFAYLDNVQLLDKGHYSESNIFGVILLFNLKLLSKVVILKQTSINMVNAVLLLGFCFKFLQKSNELFQTQSLAN